MRKDAQQVHVDTQRKLQEAQRKVEVQRQRTSQEIKKVRTYQSANFSDNG